MKLDASDLAELRPLIDAIVSSTVDRLESQAAKLGEKLAYLEPDAAGLIGVESYVLRDARLRGEIVGCRIGKKVCYQRGELLKFLQNRRID